MLGGGRFVAKPPPILIYWTELDLIWGGGRGFNARQDTCFLKFGFRKKELDPRSARMPPEPRAPEEPKTFW